MSEFRRLIVFKLVTRWLEYISLFGNSTWLVTWIAEFDLCLDLTWAKNSCDSTWLEQRWLATWLDQKITWLHNPERSSHTRFATDFKDSKEKVLLLFNIISFLFKSNQSYFCILNVFFVVFLFVLLCVFFGGEGGAGLWIPLTYVYKDVSVLATTATAASGILGHHVLK